ncbi:MAG: tellurium resistance protein TerC, partial [Bacillota bacterium]
RAPPPGAAGVLGLRLLLAAIVSLLLHVPLLQALGGLLLVLIAWKLVNDDRGGHGDVEAASGVLDAVRIIVLADVVMSLDNVLALVGVSGGHLGLLVLGLALSVPLIIWGSSLLSSLMDRWPWLVFAGAGILVWVAFEMVLEDRFVHRWVEGVPQSFVITVHVVVTLLFIAVAWWLAGTDPAASGGPAGGRRGGGDDASRRSR